VAINSWQSRDDAFVSVVLGVERVAREILSSGDSLVDDWLTSRLLRRRCVHDHSLLTGEDQQL
jgi:hypothetical protein